MSRQRSESEIIFSLWPILRRYHWRMILPFFFVTATVLTGTMFLPRTYRGEAAFERRTDMVLTEMTSRGASTNFQDPRQLVMEEVGGSVAVNRLLDQFYQPSHPLHATLRKAEMDRETLRDTISKRLVLTTDIASSDVDRYRLRFSGSNPDICRAIVNGLVSNYIEQARLRIELRLKQSTEFFRNEVERSRKRIDEVETRKLEYEIKNAALLSQSQAAPAPIWGVDLQSQLLDLSRQRDQAAMQLSSLRQRLETTPETIPIYTSGRNPELAESEARLRQMEALLRDYLGTLKMTPKHPDVTALQQQIAELREKMSTLPTEVVTQKQVQINPRRSELEMLISKTGAERDSLNKQVDALAARISSDNRKLTENSTDIYPVRSEHLRLNRELAESQRQLTFWEDNLRRVELAVAAENGNRGVQLNFLMPCPRLTRPESPRLQQAFLMALMLGLACGALNVFAAYRGDQTSRHPQDLAESVNLPLFGSVSEIITRQEIRRRRLMRTVIFPLNGLGMAMALGLLAFIVYLNLEKPATFEQLRSDPVKYLMGKVSTSNPPQS